MEKRLVIDTNVFVSALLSHEGASRETLRRCLQRRYHPLMGEALYWEYEDVLTQNKLFGHCPLSHKEREALLNAFMKACYWIHVYYLWRQNLSDENDNHGIELAVAGNANIVVTHNLQDFNKRELLFPDIRIMTPKQLLKIRQRK